VSLLAGDDPFGAGGGDHAHTGTSAGIDRVGLPPTYYWDTAAGAWHVTPGCHGVMVGSSSRDLPLRGSTCRG
jgi:hypothetical protein